MLANYWVNHKATDAKTKFFPLHNNNSIYFSTRIASHKDHIGRFSTLDNLKTLMKSNLDVNQAWTLVTCNHFIALFFIFNILPATKHGLLWLHIILNRTGDTGCPNGVYIVFLPWWWFDVASLLQVVSVPADQPLHCRNHFTLWLLFKVLGSEVLTICNLINIAMKLETLPIVFCFSWPKKYETARCEGGTLFVWAIGCIVQSNMKSKQWYAAEVWYHITTVGDAVMGGLLFGIPAKFR